MKSRFWLRLNSLNILLWRCWNLFWSKNLLKSYLPFKVMERRRLKSQKRNQLTSVPPKLEMLARRRLKKRLLRNLWRCRHLLQPSTMLKTKKWSFRPMKSHPHHFPHRQKSLDIFIGWPTFQAGNTQISYYWRGQRIFLAGRTDRRAQRVKENWVMATDLQSSVAVVQWRWRGLKRRGGGGQKSGTWFRQYSAIT